MKTNLRVLLSATLLLLTFTFQTAAQSGVPSAPGAASAPARTGTIEFVARVAPTDGMPKPVRALTFYLLRKSLADIRSDLESQYPAPKMDVFIDGLSVSPELKAWMKRNHTVELAGSDFVKAITPDDVLAVPEFYAAYVARNSGYLGSGFPKPKYTDRDKQQNPEKYKLLVEEFRQAVYNYCKANPDSIQGMEAEITDLNASQAWEHLKSEQRRRVENRALRLAQTDYLVAQTDSDLDGRGSMINLPAGNYWLSTLNIPAQEGDVRVRWDAQVTVRAGETTHVVLNNLNATLQGPEQ